MSFALKEAIDQSRQRSGEVPKVLVPKKDPVPALVTTIDNIALSGRVDPCHGAMGLLDALENCNKHHWASYAKQASVEPPSVETIRRVKAVYQERIDKYAQW